MSIITSYVLNFSSLFPYLAYFQEFFISEGWGESRNVSDFHKFSGILHFWGVGGEQSRNVSDFPNFQEFFISGGGGRAEQNVSDFA